MRQIVSFIKRAHLSLLLLLLVSTPAWAESETAYAVWCADNSTLYFLGSEASLTAGGTFTPEEATDPVSITNVWSGTAVTATQPGGVPEWNNNTIKNNMTRVVFESSFAGFTPTSLRGWFYQSYKLTDVEGIHNLNTSAATRMDYMFQNCPMLTNLDLSNFDTGNVLDMQYMFGSCSKLQSLNLNGWTNTKVTNMYAMMYDCPLLQAVTMTGFQTPAVQNMSYMFMNCAALTSLDLTGFDTGNVTTTQEMFNGCTNLESLNLSGWENQKLTTLTNMFRSCEKLSTLTLTGFQTPSATSFNCLFAYCKALENIDLSSFNTEKVTDMQYMFYDCEALNHLDLRHFNTAAVTNMYQMFYNCKALQTLDLSGWTNTKLTNMTQMFYGCEALSSVNLTGFVTPLVNNMGGVFYGCKALTSLDLSGWNTTAVTNMSQMFYGCEALQTLDLSGWNTAKVTNMAQMFYNCSSLESIYVSLSWTAGNATNSWNMFYGCNALVGEDGTTLASYSPQSLDRTHATDEAGGYLKTGAAIPDLDEPLAYAIWCADDATLYFIKSDKQLVTGRSFTPDGSSTPIRMTNVWSGTQVTAIGGSTPAWNNTVKTTLQHVVFEPSFADVTPNSLRAWFYQCTALTDLQGISNLNTDGVTQMDYMFSGATTIQHINLSGLNTANVTNMSYMFQNCSSLQSLDLTGLNTEKVTNMNYMFQNCSSLQSLDVTMLGTAKVNYMQYMFNGCSGLTSLDVSSFTMNNIFSLDYMFKDCSGLTDLDLSSFNIGTRSPSIREMFSGCTQLQCVYVSNLWTLARRTDADVFKGCTSIVGEDGSAYDASAVTAAKAHYGAGGYLRKGTQAPDNETAASYAIYCADNQTIYFTYTRHNLMQGSVFIPEGETTGHVVSWLKKDSPTYSPYWDNMVTLNATKAVFESSFSTYEPTSLYRTFYGCTALTVVSGLEHLNTESVTSMQETFYGCTSLQALDLSSFVTTRVTSMYRMFYNCSALQTILVGDGWTTSSASNSTEMFYGCTSLPNFDAAATDKTNAHPYEGGYLGEGSSVPIAPTVYAIWSADTKTLYFLKSTKLLVPGRRFTPAGSETAVGITTVWTDGDFLDRGTNSPAWAGSWYSNYSSSFEHVVFEPSFAEVKPTSTYQWFNNCTALLDITGLEYLNTEDVTTMYCMFQGCRLLTTLDLSHWGTAKVTNMREMFQACSALETLNLSSFTTPEVTTLEDMFYGCKALKALDLHGFSNEKVTSIKDMFYGCSALETLNMHGFGIGTVTSLQDMFEDCTSLKALDLSTFNTSAVTSMGYLFSGCEALESVDLSSFNTEGVTSMSYMFYNCKSLLTLDLGHFNTEKVNYFSQIFKNCAALESLNLSGWTCKVNSLSGMFDGCSQLQTLNLTGFTTPGVTDMSYMFNGCSSLRALDLSSFSTSEVTNMNLMFNGCSSLETLDLSNFVGTKVGYVNSMFNGCASLKSLDLHNFAETKVTNFRKWFAGCTALESLNMPRLAPTSIADMSGMFKDCRSLTQLDLSGWNTTQVTNMSEMFSGCSSLLSLDLSSFTTKAVTTFSQMFAGCTSLTNLNLSSFSSVQSAYNNRLTNMSGMFLNCEELTAVDISGIITYNVTNFSSLYEGCKSMESIDVSKLQTNNCRNFSRMFAGCEKLKSIDVSDFIVGSSAWYPPMNDMFNGCSALEGITFAIENNRFEVRSNDISGMFKDCTSLTDIDLSTFNTRHTENMSSMFEGCTGLTQLDLSPFYTDALTNFSRMFAGCVNLEHIYVYPQWDVTDIDQVNAEWCANAFEGCIALVGQDGTAYDASRYSVGQPVADWSVATVQAGGYLSCKAAPVVFKADGTLYFLYLNDWTSKIRNEYKLTGSDTPIENVNFVYFGDDVLSDNFRLYYFDDEINPRSSVQRVLFDASFAQARPRDCMSWFQDCINLTDVVGLEYLNLSEATSINSLFKGCSSLTSLDMSVLDVSHVEDMGGVFNGCSALTSLNVSGWDTGSVTNMEALFMDCSSLTSLDVSHFDTSNTMIFNNMFMNCYNLQTIDVSHFDTSNADDLQYMFAACSSLKHVDVSGFNTSLVYSMESMFNGCISLEEIDVSGFDNHACTEMTAMFAGCRKIKELDLSNLGCYSYGDGMQAVHANYLFYNCSALERIYVSEEWINQYSDLDNNLRGTMFVGCTSIVGETGTTYDPNNVNFGMANAEGGYFSYKGVTVTIPSSGVATFSAPYNTIVPETLTAWIAPDYEGDASFIQLYQVPNEDFSSAPTYYHDFNTVAPAGSGLLLRGEPGLTVKMVRTQKHAAIKDSPYFEHNMLMPVVEAAHIDKSLPLGEDLGEALTLSGSTFCRMADGGIDMPAYEAYLAVPTAALQKDVVYLCFETLTGNSGDDGYYWATYYNAGYGSMADGFTDVFTVKVNDDNTKVTLMPVEDGIIPAGNAVVLRSTQQLMPLLFTTGGLTLANNDLQGSDTDITTPANTYMLVKGNHGVGFYHWTGETIPAHRGWLTLAGAATAPEFLSIDEDYLTALRSTKQLGEDAGNLYDLAGRRLTAAPHQGIYVEKGRKTYVKSRK